MVNEELMLTSVIFCICWDFASVAKTKEVAQLQYSYENFWPPQHKNDKKTTINKNIPT